MAEEAPWAASVRVMLPVPVNSAKVGASVTVVLVDLVLVNDVKVVPDVPPKSCVPS